MPLIIGVVLVGGPLFAGCVALALVVALGEIARIVGVSVRSPLFLCGAATIGAVIGAAESAAITMFWPVLAALIGIASLTTWTAVREVRVPQPALLRPILSSGLAMLGAALYLALPGATFLMVRSGPEGMDWFLIAILAIMSADATAYAGGRLFGRRQLAASVSPNKTVEGAIFGWLGGFGATLALDQILGTQAGLWPLLLLALTLPLLSQLGDLTESLFKRAMDVKDSSQLIPGHGGVLDRLDSLLFGLPVVFFFLQWTT